MLFSSFSLFLFSLDRQPSSAGVSMSKELLVTKDGTYIQVILKIQNSQ